MARSTRPAADPTRRAAFAGASEALLSLGVAAALVGRARSAWQPRSAAEGAR